MVDKLCNGGAFDGKIVGLLFEIRGKMNGTMYKNTLQDNLLSYWKKKCGSNYMYQHDKNPKQARQAMTFALKKNPLLKWTAQSRDLNPIENLSNELENVCGIMNIPIQLIFYQKFHEPWEKLKTDYLQLFIESIPRHRAEVFIAKCM